MTNAQTTAIDAFIARTASIMKKLAVITEVVDDHMGIAPDDVNWNNVGDLGYIDTLLNELTSFMGLDS